MLDFYFQISQWRGATIQPTPSPTDTPTEQPEPILLLDPSPTSNPQSDESAFACGFMSQDGDKNVLTVLDMASGKYKGGALVDETIRLIEKWKPDRFSYENIPGMDWFRDLLLLKASLKGIAVPYVHAFSPYNGKGCKEKRICRLQTLFDCEPPAIVFHRGPYCEKLYDAAERFRMGSDKKGAENGLLDALSLIAGFR